MSGRRGQNLTRRTECHKGRVASYSEHRVPQGLTWRRSPVTGKLTCYSVERMVADVVADRQGGGWRWEVFDGDNARQGGPCASPELAQAEAEAGIRAGLPAKRSHRKAVESGELKVESGVRGGDAA